MSYVSQNVPSLCTIFNWYKNIYQCPNISKLVPISLQWMKCTKILIVLRILRVTSNRVTHTKTDWLAYLTCHFQLPNKQFFSLILATNSNWCVCSQVSPIWPLIVLISLSYYLNWKLNVTCLLHGKNWFLWVTWYKFRLLVVPWGLLVRHLVDTLTLSELNQPI